jgi:hypothetical protein
VTKDSRRENRNLGAMSVSSVAYVAAAREASRPSLPRYRREQASRPSAGQTSHSFTASRASAGKPVRIAMTRSAITLPSQGVRPAAQRRDRAGHRGPLLPASTDGDWRSDVTDAVRAIRPGDSIEGFRFNPPWEDNPSVTSWGVATRFKDTAGREWEAFNQRYPAGRLERVRVRRAAGRVRVVRAGALRWLGREKADW